MKYLFTLNGFNGQCSYRRVRYRWYLAPALAQKKGGRHDSRPPFPTAQARDARRACVFAYRLRATGCARVPVGAAQLLDLSWSCTINSIRCLLMHRVLHVVVSMSVDNTIPGRYSTCWPRRDGKGKGEVAPRAAGGHPKRAHCPSRLGRGGVVHSNRSSYSELSDTKNAPVLPFKGGRPPL